MAAPVQDAPVDRLQINGARPQPGSVVLRTHALTKRFDGLTAVDNLDLEVRAGEVHGFLGPNGAGKSTTVGMILGLIAPTSGRIALFGRDANEARERAAPRIGAIVEAPAFYPYLSGRDNLRALAMTGGGVPAGRIDDLLDLVGLRERAGSAYKTYSLGMKQRLGIASTLLTDPTLVILDEPTNGLDPAGQREVRELIPRLAAEGRAVLLASHLLHEVEQVCDRVTIIRRGRLRESGRVQDLLHRDAYLDVLVAEPERALAVLRAAPPFAGAQLVNEHIRLAIAPEQGADVSRLLAGAGLYPATMVPHQSSLEDIFLELTETADGPALVPAAGV